MKSWLKKCFFKENNLKNGKVITEQLVNLKMNCFFNENIGMDIDFLHEFRTER